MTDEDILVTTYEVYHKYKNNWLEDGEYEIFEEALLRTCKLRDRGYDTKIVKAERILFYKMEGVGEVDGH